jgi:serine phosphatase RsbU (regulator of sigma subunit)
MSRAPELHVKPLHGEPYRFTLDKEVITIGRSKKNDLVLADQWLSRIHAEIRRENSRHFIRDLDSRNGTYVNGMRLSQRVPLQNGDVVTLGDQQIRFVHDMSGPVVLTETPAALDVEGTLVVSTQELLQAARAKEDTWDNLVGGRGGRPGASSSSSSLADDSARIIKQNQILSALSQASMALISNRPLNELLDFILELAFKVIRAERGVLMLTTESGKYSVEAVRTADGKNTAEEIAFSKSIANKVVEEKVSILTRNALDDPRFDRQMSIISLRIRSAMCVPLWHDDAVTGLIYVDSLRENSFNQDDLTLLSSLANVAAVKLENAKLLEEMIEKKRMERELELAREIQQNSLPGQAPRFRGFDILGSNTPCYTIGGDYFDFIQRPHGLAVALGDVSGKGTGAALMMMVLRAAVHFACQRESDVLAILSETNGVMYDNSPSQFFATFFLGDIEEATGRMRYVNAGHIPPFFYRARTRSLERLSAGGTVLGLFPEAQFNAGDVEFDAGDTLVVFTDGLSEAWGSEEEEFGEDRIGALIRENASLPAKDLERLIQNEVEVFTSGARPTDDRTLIVVKRN